MTPDRRFEQELPGLLEDLYVGPMPVYRDDVLQRTARTRQRPVWTLVERWLPKFARLPMAPRLSWRSIGLAVLLAGIALAMLAALIAGSRPRIPAPFGPARAGLVAYASNGDIYTVDPRTGTSTAAVTGPETDIEPRWSRDGTRFAFERKADSDQGPGWVFIARADGSDLVRITPKPLFIIEDYAFSPGGQEVLISTGPIGISSQMILIAAADGSQIRRLDVGRPATHPGWRPPDGAEILFMDDVHDGYSGLYAISVDGEEVRTILERSVGRSRDLAAWSPDGSQIAYIEWVDADSITARIHIIGSDGQGDFLMPMPPDAVWEVFRSWSNDGTRLLAIRGYTDGWEESVAVVRPADGSGFGVEIHDQGIRDANCCSSWEWAPDDTSILGTPIDALGRSLQQVLLNPDTGTSTAIPWTTSSHPTWQRLAR